MKVPTTPPDFEDLTVSILADPSRVLAIFGAVTGPLVSGKYLHWDKVRYHQPPGDLSLEEWWYGIKLRRRGQRVPLVDKAGEPFSFGLADPLPETLHRIDLTTGGSIGMGEGVTNPETRNTYLVRSLVEEAFTSSQLEGAASTRKIADDLIRGGRAPRDRGERMILNNYRAMRRIIELKDEPLTERLVFEIHRIVTEDALDDPTGAGRFRREDEGGIVVGDEEGNVFHVPPGARQLESRMAALCDFANDPAEVPFVHPAIRSMILHFWLAYDHPFIDGNGRTARALFYWSMLRRGYWLFEFLSISREILESPIKYGRAFLHTETDGNDLTYFLIYHAAIIRKAIDGLIAYLDRRSGELKSLEQKLRGMGELNHRQRELIRHALRHPGSPYTVESHRASHDVSRQTAANDLAELADKGLLRKGRAGRELKFVAVPDLERRLM